MTLLLALPIMVQPKRKNPLIWASGRGGGEQEKLDTTETQIKGFCSLVTPPQGSPFFLTDRTDANTQTHGTVKPLA